MSFRGQWVRRTLSVLLATFVLIVAPQVAHAAFTARTAPTMSVGTASMAELTNLNGSYRCIRSGSSRQGVNVDIASFDDAGPSGATYDYRLTFRNQTLDTDSSTRRSTSLSYRHGNVNQELTYTFTVRATLGNWTGPLLSRDLTC